MTLKEYIDVLMDYAYCYGEDIEIISFHHEHEISPAPNVFYDDENDRIVTD